jgi:hypothetical protein
MSVGVVSVPASFETLRAAVGPEKVGEVLIECPDDLEEVKRAIAEVTTSGQGKLLFLRGTSGVGKTSLVESVPVFLADAVNSVLTAPPEFETPLLQLPGWLAGRLPAAREQARGKLVLVNLDQREIPVLDETATQAAMGNLNGILRNTPNTLLVWPVNRREFAAAAVNRLVQAGGQTALVQRPVYEMRGLPKARFYDALQLLLAATAVRLEDAAITNEEVEALADRHDNIGEYLRGVQALVVARYDIGELGRRLPRLYIVVSSNDDTYQTCRLLRRGNKFLLDPQRLLQLSRANVADDWRRRGEANPRRSFAFVASLFEVRLLNLSSSAMVNAVAWGPDQALQSVVRQHYQANIRSNAANALRNSALARALREEADVGIATSNPSDAVRAAYRAVQSRTNEKHRQINQAVMHVLTEQLGIALGDPRYEYRPFPQGEEGLTADVWIERGERPEAIEFTHRRDGDAGLGTISSYLLTKVQDYARDYSLV